MKKIRFALVTTVVGLLTLGTGLQAQAGLLYAYNRLATKDLDEMTHLIRAKISESKKESGNKSMPLREALQAVFSRPDHDGLVSQLLPPLKNELDDLNAWDLTIKALVKEALGALGNPKAFRPEAQVTYAVFLENVIAEFKPKASEPLQKSILTTIRDAKIELSKEARRERQLRMMETGVSPSELARNVLEALNAKPQSPEPTSPPEKSN